VLRLIPSPSSSGLALTYTYTSLGYASQVTGPGGVAYWTANVRDAELRLTQQTAGNGVVTTQSFDAQTGRLLDILAGTGNIVQNFSYTYDVARQRADPRRRTRGKSKFRVRPVGRPKSRRCDGLTSGRCRPEVSCGSIWKPSFAGFCLFGPRSKVLVSFCLSTLSLCGLVSTY
jgi:hypothetical protein